MISGGLDGVLRTWDVGSAAQRKVINLGSASPVSMLIAPRGGWVAVGDGDGGVRLFDIRTGQLRHALRGHDAPVWSLAVSHDGTRLASGDSDAGAIVWDVAAGRAVTKLSTTNGWITSLCFSPDDTALAEGRADSTIRLLRLSDLSTGSILRGHRRAVVHVDWQPDGTLHTVSLDGTTKTWSAQSASQIPTIITGQPHCNALALSPDGRRIFVGGSDGTVRSWDLRPDENEPPAQGPQLPAHDRGVLEIAVSAAGNRVCSAGQDGVVHVSPLTGDGAVVTINPGSGSISAVEFSPDGSRLVLGTAGEISLWDAGSGNKLRDYASKGVVPNEITFDASGNFFYAACADGHVRRWRTDSPAAVAEAMIDAAGVYDVRPSTDGRSVVATGDTQTVVLLDAATLQIARRFTGHQGAVFAAAFHPGGNRLATCGTDRTIRIWDLATGTELIALRGHRQSVQDIVFSADGRTLVSGGDDGTVKLWRTLPQ